MGGSPSGTAPLVDEGATAAFASFIATRREERLPGKVRRATCRAFANWLACAIGGQREELVQQLVAVVLRTSGHGRASLAGRPEYADCINAALLNGFAANVLDYDDMHVPTLIHPTVPVVAAALAVGEERGVTGEVLVAAIAAGIEVECRLGLALFPHHYDAGWHSTSTLGMLGAATSACVVAGLGDTQAAHALGIAATQASGLRAMLPTPSKSFNTAHAASAGVRAMVLAEAGLESDTAVLEGKFGFFKVFGQPRDAAELVADLGARYIVSEISLKPYPCGIVIHPLIDACLEIARGSEITAESLRAVHATVHPRALELADRRHPDTPITARFSLHHAAALAFAFRSAGLATFDRARIDDSQLVRLRSLMTIVADHALEPGEARVRIDMSDGRTMEHEVRHPSGSPERPLTEAQLEEKFMELVQPATSRASAAALFDDCLNLDRIAAVRTLRRHWVEDTA